MRYLRKLTEGAVRAHADSVGANVNEGYPIAPQTRSHRRCHIWQRSSFDVYVCLALALSCLGVVVHPIRCVAAPPTGVPVYKVTAIGGITGLRVNQMGDVAGWTTRNGLAVPMLHTSENGTIVLPTSNIQPYGVARDVSDRAAGVITVVGEARLDSSGSAIHAVRWRVAIPQGIVTNVTDLGVLPGGSESAAYAINDADQIAGTSDAGSSLSIRSFIYSPAKGMTDLGLGSTGTSARALDMNGSGLIAGYLGLEGISVVDDGRPRFAGDASGLGQLICLCDQRQRPGGRQRFRRLW